MRGSSDGRLGAMLAATVVLMAGAGVTCAAAQQADSAAPHTDSAAHATTDSLAKKKKGGLLGAFGKHKGTIAKAALAATGAGAVAMLAKPGAGANPAAAMASAMSGAVGTGPTPGMPSTILPGAPKNPAKMMAMAAGDADVRQMQQDLSALSVRVTSGDTVAARQYRRFQREIAAAGATFSSDPIGRLRAAYACAMTGAGCHTPEL